MSILNTIHGHEDLVALTDAERTLLCQEIRDFLVSHVCKTGGHLASNLGVVELTVALEIVYNTAHDRLVFDVGHQSYVHKLLTGRQADFEHLRQFGGIAGFPKPGESGTDAFVAGHASSSVSVGLGMARARTLMKQDYHVAVLLGDGAATGGMVYEGLNDAAVSREPMVIILNDNAMSIDRNVGGVATHLSRLRSSEEYIGMKHWYTGLMERIPGGRTIFRFTRNIKERIKRLLLPSTIFENMGLEYLGPVDGHDLSELISVLRIAKGLNRPVLVHVNTQKGHGYKYAQEHPSKFHGVGKFDPITGETEKSQKQTFSDAFGQTMMELAREDSRICAITAAMPGGTGLLEFKKTFLERTFDVGIAEEHAVSMAGGLAKQGMIPVVAIYSTFLQRAFDQIQQDICLLGLHAVFAVDRAGLVGEDGETHHGLFDIGFLRQMPGMRILCPASLEESSQMLRWATLECSGPVAVRFPRGGDRSYSSSDWHGPEAPVRCYRRGADVTLITYGTMLENVMEAAELLSQSGVEASVLRLLQVAPLPVEQIIRECAPSGPVVVVEETAAASGIFGELAALFGKGTASGPVYGMNLGYHFVTHGKIDTLYRHYGLDGRSIADYVLEVHHEN